MIASDFELTPGQMVGEYRVERKIGEGAFGKVYAAIHPVIGKPAAVKILKPALSTSQEMVKRFADEARAVNQIRHRNIIDIFSFGTLPDGVSYFVMELLEGMTFQQYLRKNGPLDPAVAFSILWPVGRALSAAHRAGIAHRDLKPENIFLVLDPDGGMFPKLLDFGIAKLLGDSDMVQRTKTGMVLGTPVYMSPEQCRATQVDHRSDIYAFGIMTHEALAGRRPFDAENVMDVIMKQISDPPPRLSACRPGLPPALDAPLLHMLEKSPARRPQTMQAALDELAEAARSCGIQAPASLPQGAGALPPSGPAQLAPAPSAPAAPQPAASSSMATDAWLQQQSAQSRSMPVPAGSVAVSAASAQVPSLILEQPPSAARSAPSSAHPAFGAHSPPASYAAPGAQAPPGAHSPPASYAAPGSQAPPGAHSPPASYAAPGPAPADAATLMSAGVLPRASSPSVPGGPVSASMSGFAPASAAQPTSAPKSKVPLFLGIAGGGVLLLLVLIVGIGLGSSSSHDDGSGPAPAASASPATSAVLIGAAPPRVGRTFDNETDTALHIDVSLPGAARPLASSAHGEHRKYKVTVLAVNEWHATRLEIDYSDTFDTSQENGAPEKKTPSPTANRGFFVAAQDSGPSVSPVDGKQITEKEKSAVLSDVDELLKPRPDVFRRPLSVGDSISPPPAVAGPMLGVVSHDPEVTTRAENAVLRLTSIDHAHNGAVFDVQYSLVYDQKTPKCTFTATLKGTLTFDLPTGIVVAGKVSGPLKGTLTESGVKTDVSGSLSMSMKADVTP